MEAKRDKKENRNQEVPGRPTGQKKDKMKYRELSKHGIRLS